MKTISLLSRWQLQLPLAILVGLVAARLAGSITSQTVQCALAESSAYVPLLSVLATVLALVASLLIGHTLQFVNNAAQEKASLYDRFRDVLYRLDDFLRHQDRTDVLVEAAQAVSFALKRLRRQDLPLQDWPERVSPFMEAAKEHKKSHPKSNLHWEIAAFLMDCESVHNEIAICWVKQLIAPLFVRSVAKMLFLLSLLLIGLFVMVSLQGALPLGVNVGVPAFFVMAAILVCIELGLAVWRHSRDMSDLTEDLDGSSQHGDEEDE